MNRIGILAAGLVVAALTSTVVSTPSAAATFVYISNAEDGDIGTYVLSDSGELQPGARVTAAAMVTPLAVSSDRRFLYAASQAKPYTALVYSINARTGALTHTSATPLPDSFTYISLDKTGRTLFGASYFGHLVGVSAVSSNGHVAATPTQMIPIGRHANSIHVDNTNRFVYATSLGSDAMFMFHFDAKTGRLNSHTPAVAMMKAYTGPRHFAISADNRFLYVLNELIATVTTFRIDGRTGLLEEVSTAGALQPDAGLSPGLPRIPMTSSMMIRHVEKDIWAADIHLTPDGKFAYVSERNSDAINTLSVDSATGKLTYLGTTPTERQPRSFAIDPKGRYLVVAGEQSRTVSVHAIDSQNGGLKLLGKYPSGKGASWVEIVSFD